MRGRPLDVKKNIAKNLELLEAALVRVRWEQADVMRPVREWMLTCSRASSPT